MNNQESDDAAPVLLDPIDNAPVSQAVAITARRRPLRAFDVWMPVGVLAKPVKTARQFLDRGRIGSFLGTLRLTRER